MTKQDPKSVGDHTCEEEPKESDAVPTETGTTTEVTEVIEEPADAAVESDAASDSAAAEAAEAKAVPVEADGKTRRQINRTRVLAYGVLPVLALLLAMAAGVLKWVDGSTRNAEEARIESVQAAKDSTIAMLTYQPDTVEQQLGAAAELLTGEFKNSYTTLVNDVVIPGAKQQRVAATASVPAAASASADPDDAVVLVFVNQIAVVGDSPPTQSVSSLRVTMEKIDGRWLISGFDPI